MHRFLWYDNCFIIFTLLLWWMVFCVWGSLIDILLSVGNKSFTRPFICYWGNRLISKGPVPITSLKISFRKCCKPRSTTKSMYLNQGRTRITASYSRFCRNSGLNRVIMSANGGCGSFNCEKRIALSWRRGRSATRHVSLKRTTRRSVVDTSTPKWLATCWLPTVVVAVSNARKE